MVLRLLCTDGKSVCGRTAGTSAAGWGLKITKRSNKVKWTRTNKRKAVYRRNGVYIARATVCQYNARGERARREMRAAEAAMATGGAESRWRWSHRRRRRRRIRCLRCYDTILREISHLQEKTIIRN